MSNHTKDLIRRIKEKHSPLAKAAGPLLQVYDEEGQHLWSCPGTEGYKEAVCLKFTTDRGKVAYLEGSGCYKSLTSREVDLLWDLKIAPYPLFTEDECWEEVSWVIVEKSESHLWS